MKKILVLILIGLLAACESSALIEEEDVLVEPEVVVSEPVEVEVMTYVVRYVIGYSGLIEEQIKEANAVVRLMLPEREGYRFDGWFLDEAFTRPTDRFVTIQSDLDVYAKWIEIIKEPQEIVFEGIRSHFSFDYTTTHPIDYYVSPSQQQAKADTIYQGMSIAAGLLAPYLEGLDPLSITVLHPKDQAWYEEHIKALDLFDYGDPWFERTSSNGGAAVMESYSGRPHMFYNIPDQNTPNATTIDYFVHETFHVFQLGRLSGDRQNRDRNLGCMYTEGGATLIGNVLAYVEESSALLHFENARRGRIQTLQTFYSNESELSAALYDQLINGQNDRCNVQEPGFGYTLGALVAEKMVLDFGIENFMAMHYDFNRYRIDQVFEDRFDTNYFEWIEEEAVPYVIDLFT
jgi:uncharacterized repeat protein (TIGR02543 family)